jgi:hypothetical protein
MTAHRVEEVKKEEDYSQYIHAIMSWMTSNIATLVVGGLMLMVIMFLIASLGSCVGSGRAY